MYIYLKQSIYQVFKNNKLIWFPFHVLCSSSWDWNLVIVPKNNLQLSCLLALSNPLLQIITFEKTLARKAKVSIPQQNILNVFILRNSRKYMLVCLYDNKNIFVILWSSYMNGKTTQHTLHTVTCCFNYAFLLSDPTHMK